MRDSARVTSLPVKLAPSHCVAAGLVLAGTGAPAHTLSILRIGGRSTMPRNDGASDVGGGSVRLTRILSVHTPPLSLQTLTTESLSVRANTRMLGPLAPSASLRTSVLVTVPEWLKPTVNVRSGERCERNRRIWKSPNSRSTV